MRFQRLGFHRGPLCFADRIGKPLGVFLLKRRLVIVQGFFRRGDFGVTLIFHFLLSRGYFLLVGGELSFRFLNAGLAGGFALGGVGGEFLLVSGQFCEQRLMFGLDGLQQANGLGDFLWARGAVENAEVQFINQLGVIGLFLYELGDGVVGVTDGVVHGGTSDECHNGAELEPVDAFAFTGTFAGWAAEGAEESVGQAHTHIG